MDGLIATAIDDGNLIDCAEDDAGGLIASIYSGVSMKCADLYISDDTANGLIAATINVYGLIATPIDSTKCADTNVLDDDVDILTMLMC